MKGPNVPDIQLERSEQILLNGAYDISAKYLALVDLNRLIQSRPAFVNASIPDILESVFQDPHICGETQAFFFFREAARVLCTLISNRDADGTSDRALAALERLLSSEAEAARRAASEALGSLPFTVAGDDFEDRWPSSIPVMHWEDVLACLDREVSSPLRWHGRSLVASLEGVPRLLVIKMARREENPLNLLREIHWIARLAGTKLDASVRFNIPTPLDFDGQFLVRLRDLPVAGEVVPGRHHERYAVVFLADPEYFLYPNEGPEQGRVPPEQFREILLRNAWLLGRLASRGIVHTAPIPLFHNRVQRRRREDLGRYRWQRGGRLDRWVQSCRYPNIGPTGIRDFEHFIGLRGRSKDLYSHIGTHLLSLQLLAGSYFRSKNPGKIGTDPSGEPTDARNLFDRPFFRNVICGIFTRYYEGFVGTPFSGNLPIDLSTLTDRMIEEMGVDRHMEEILRVRDQQEMTDASFREFLIRRGMAPGFVQGLHRATADISISSGPHLGGFNQRISLPELIDAVAAVAALCIAGRYVRLRAGRPGKSLVGAGAQGNFA